MGHIHTKKTPLKCLVSIMYIYKHRDIEELVTVKSRIADQIVAQTFPISSSKDFWYVVSDFKSKT